MNGRVMATEGSQLPSVHVRFRSLSGEELAFTVEASSAVLATDLTVGQQVLTVTVPSIALVQAALRGMGTVDDAGLPEPDADRPRRILYVDHEPVDRSVAEKVLVLGGFEVATAADGATAIELARAWQPDVIFLDAVMPVMDGPKTLTALRSDAATTRIPIVYMPPSVLVGPDRQPDGATDVLAKPLDLEVLVALAERYGGA